MLVVIRRLENWRHLLEGAKFKFEVWTDHKRFKFTLKYVPETKIGKYYKMNYSLICDI